MSNSTTVVPIVQLNEPPNGKAINFKGKNERDYLFGDDFSLKLFIGHYYKCICGKSFTISSLTGPKGPYDISAIDREDVSQLTFYYSKGIEIPFLLVIETSTVGSCYYLSSTDDVMWKRSSQYVFPQGHKKHEFLDLLKMLFSRVHGIQLHLYETSFNKRDKYNQEFNIIRDARNSTGYDRYLISEKQCKSILAMYFDDEKLGLGESLRFAESIWLYFFSGDTSTPLMVAAETYKIYDEPALYYYYKRESIGSSKWTSIESLSKSKGLKTALELKPTLDEIGDEYSKRDVTIEIRKQENFDFNPTFTTRFNGIPFRCVCTDYGEYLEQTYKPKLCSLFKPQGINIGGIEQSIRFENKQWSTLSVYFYKGEETPALICLKLDDRTGDESSIIWYKCLVRGGLVWVGADFKADPDKEQGIIGIKIKGMYGKTGIGKCEVMAMALVFVIVISMFGVWVFMKYGCSISPLFSGWSRFE